jgi:hypothetical protein
MREADKPEFSQLIADVYKFYRAEVSTFALSVWWTSMAQYDFAAVREALGRHTMNPDTGQFLPKPADVVKMLAGTTQDTALVAWTMLEKAIRQVGPYQSVCFDDALVNRVVTDMGGWIEFGKVLEDELPFKRNEFVTRYRAFKMRSERPEYPAKLIGIAESENGANLKVIAPPVLIGNQERAALVYANGGEQKPLLAKTITQLLQEIAA